MHRIVLVVLDGWGIAPAGPGNCLSQAKLPFYQSLIAKYPHCQLKAHGNSVGLQDTAMGTSEVGHLAMGAGRIVWQPVAQIDNEIKTEKFFTNKNLQKAFETAKKRNSAVHLMGL